jgi:hypothetical protein
MGVDPIVACIYGTSGIGKTVDCGFSFPTAVFIAAPGALTSVKRTCGYEPKTLPLNTIKEAIEALKKLEGKTEVVVFDDFSYITERTFADLDGKFTGFKLWNKLRDVVIDFRDAARYAGIHIVLTCWEQEPTMKNGSRMRGGPKLAAKLHEQIPSMCDLVLRAVHEPAREPWPMSYHGRPDPSWVQKDRLNVASRVDPCPPNLREILFAADIDLPRHPNFPKQEARVAAIASRLLETELDAFPAEVENMYKRLKESSAVSAVEARWIMRDAVDRVTLRRELDRFDGNFINSSESSDDIL